MRESIRYKSGLTAPLTPTVAQYAQPPSTTPAGTATSTGEEARNRADAVLGQIESLRAALDRVLDGKSDSKLLQSPTPPPAACAVAADFNAISETLSSISTVLADIFARLAV